MQPLDVAILLDPKNNWLEEFVTPFVTDVNLNNRFKVCIYHDWRLVRNYELVFVLGYTRLLPPEFLADNGLVLVVHESELPQGKGFSPVQWQVLEGKNNIPVCLFEATEQADSGDIIERGVIRLNGSELLSEIRSKQAAVTLELVRRVMHIYPEIRREPQQGQESWYRRRNRQDDRLNPDKTIREQFNLFRIAHNDDYPLYVTINNRRYLLKIYADEEL